MDLVIDNDVKAVAAYMQAHVPAARLVSVANAVQALAPILWAQYAQEGVSALLLRHATISDRDSHTQPSASE